MRIETVKVPDIGDFVEVPVIEVMVKAGDTVSAEQPLITLESDKAAMDVPSPSAGQVQAIQVKVGDTVSQGSVILHLEVGDASAKADSKDNQPKLFNASIADSPASPSLLAPAEPNQALIPEISDFDAPRPPDLPPINEAAFVKAHASPAVRKFARELGVDLSQVTGTGRKGRIVKTDVQGFTKQVMQGNNATLRGATATTAEHSGIGIPPIPVIDFSQFGDIETRPLSRIQKLSGASLHRSWLNLPHVTQFDEADITELETFRKSLVEEGQQRGIKITLLAFLLKASVAVLREYPTFNASLDPNGEQLIVKKYFHIGVAVDTPDGLVVPVIRDVNFKGLFELAEELGVLSDKAREQKLSPKEMQGASFTISSLGGIGGTAFTPIINAPEVAILGVSRAKWQPVYQAEAFVPHLMLPLSLSYDHRVIDGAAAARFTSYLGFILSDVRRLLL